jgi:hypothetical protein
VNVCRECAAPVIWAKTRNGVAIPLDRAPSLVGNILLTGTLAVKVPAAQLPIEDQDAYTCHLDTCQRKRTPLALVKDHTARCAVCNQVMHPLLVATRQTTHPCC